MEAHCRRKNVPAGSHEVFAAFLYSVLTSTLFLTRYANGDVYDGEWVEGRRCGRGKYCYVNGDMFIGAFAGASTCLV